MALGSAVTEIVYRDGPMEPMESARLLVDPMGENPNSAQHKAWRNSGAVRHKPSYAQRIADYRGKTRFDDFQNAKKRLTHDTRKCREGWNQSSAGLISGKPPDGRQKYSRNEPRPKGGRASVRTGRHRPSRLQSPGWQWRRWPHTGNTSAARGNARVG